ncbi:TPA: hypothetical protein J5F57_003523 [Escherichia coli]|uniref:hypothetical protein n=1 Tax=Hafnia paralvei TaxID=546367 RepID=UPI001B099EAC|nr:hypothetical protein [Hafnia paralvei]MBU2672616.1 hypothetical protein [Hafnia paralvei]HBA3651385.1 hypothetical protein [Escherichia coli]
MEKYLYLKEASWVEAWVSGGVVPFRTASFYRREFRESIYTPDENLIDTSSHDVKILNPYIKFIDGADVVNSTFTVSVNEELIVKDAIVNRVYEDGLIVSLSNTSSRSVCERFKKSACVRIGSVEYLKEIIDAQLKTKGIMDECLYTKSHHRGHFLKHVDDSWQDEFRLFWQGVESSNINLPKGVASVEFIL